MKIEFDFSRLHDELLPCLIDHAKERATAISRVLYDAMLVEVIRRGRVKRGVPCPPVEIVLLLMEAQEMADALADLEDWAATLEVAADLATDSAAAELLIAIEMLHATERAIAAQREMILAVAAQPPN